MRKRYQTGDFHDLLSFSVVGSCIFLLYMIYDGVVIGRIFTDGGFPHDSHCPWYFPISGFRRPDTGIPP